MKNVPTLRFKEFSGEWNTKKIGDIFDVTSGTTPSRSVNEFFHNGQHHWIKTTDLNNGYITDTQEKVTDLALKKTSLKLLPECTVLVAMYGGFNQIGRTGLLTRKAAVNQALSALLPKVDVVNPYYLLSYLNFHIEDWKAFAASSRKDPNITKSDVLNFEFSYPILTEQTKIADFLTAIDERISQLAHKCELLGQYKKAVMQQIFSQELRFKDAEGRAFPAWEEKRLGDLYSFKITNSFSRENLNYDIGTVKNIHYGDIHTKFSTLFDITKEKVPFINEDISLDKIKSENYCAEGDLIFADASEDLNDVGKSIEIINLNGEKLLSGLHTLLARQIDNFFYIGFSGYLFKSNDMRIKIQREAQGSKVLSISATRLVDIKISVPSKPEQEKIAGFLSVVDEKISQAQAKLDALRQYKQGLLQQMFV